MSKEGEEKENEGLLMLDHF